MTRRTAAAIDTIAVILLVILTTTPVPAVTSYWSHNTNHTLTTTTGAFFNDSVTLDADDSVIRIIEPAGKGRNRLDWDAAMTACQAAGYDHTECGESVNDGEF